MPALAATQVSDAVAPVSVVVIDDSPVFRRAICISLSRDARLKIVGTAENGREGLRLLESIRPAVALVDMRMPGMSGADFARTATARFPEVSIVALTVSECPDDLADMLRGGGRGYVLKSRAAEDVPAAAMAARRGESWLSPLMAGKLIDSYKLLPANVMHEQLRDSWALTPKEQSVLSLLSQGMTNADIGVVLDVAETTVKSHVKSILAKIGAKNRSEAVAISWRLRLVD
jgi:DNA-binding NarL/FixJ family response regulator